MQRKLQTIKKGVIELTVIVIGVLIALWADDLATQRTARKVEALRIEALRTNVDETLSRLDNARNGVKRAEQALRIISSMELGSAQPADSLFMTGILYGTADFFPELNVYQDLKSSGELGLLRNTKLRRALATMDASLERVEIYQADLLEVQQLNYDRFAIEELDLAQLMGANLSLEIEDSLTNRSTDALRIRNLAVFKLNLVMDLIAVYDRAESSLLEVLESMDSTID